MESENVIEKKAKRTLHNIAADEWRATDDNKILAAIEARLLLVPEHRRGRVAAQAIEILSTHVARPAAAE